MERVVENLIRELAGVFVTQGYAKQAARQKATTLIIRAVTTAENP